jgi:glycosyltransferase involved in cell wall biosynthesis
MYNEEHTVGDLLERIQLDLKSLENRYEIIVVDDCSDDNSLNIVSKYAHLVKIVSLDVNRGKGNAVRVGIRQARGTFVIVQDSDLEYDPKDIVSMLGTAIEKNVKVVYGSRLQGTQVHLTGINRIIYKWPNQQITSYLFNVVLSGVYYLFKKVWISDLLTGYKLYERQIFSKWEPKSNGFETDHEITNHLVKMGYKIIEIPINYVPRSKSMGKKIGLKDALIALKVCALD